MGRGKACGRYVAKCKDTILNSWPCAIQLFQMALLLMLTQFFDSKILTQFLITLSYLLGFWTAKYQFRQKSINSIFVAVKTDSIFVPTKYQISVAIRKPTRSSVVQEPNCSTAYFTHYMWKQVKFERDGKTIYIITFVQLMQKLKSIIKYWN